MLSSKKVVVGAKGNRRVTFPFNYKTKPRRKQTEKGLRILTQERKASNQVTNTSPPFFKVEFSV